MNASRLFSSRLLSSVPVVIMLTMTMILGVLPALPVDEASAQGNGQYFGTKLLCPPGYDLQNSSAQNAFDNCTLPLEGPYTFSIRSDDPSYQGSSQQSNGQFGWTDVPLGSDYYVAEAKPEGYPDPWVYCEVSQFAAGGGDFQTYYFQAPGGEMFIAGGINTYELANCYWFNAPPGQQQTGTTVTIEKYYCPAGYDSQPRTLENYTVDCTTPHQGARFSLQQDLGNPQQTGQNGQTAFGNVPYGDVGLRELKTDQWRLGAAYCKAIPSGDSGTVYQEVDLKSVDEEQQAWHVPLNVTDGNRIVCLFYNIPEEEGATVYIRKYLCPSEYDESAANLSYLDSLCDPHEGASFNVPFDTTGASGDTDSNGYLELHGVPYGTVEVHETANPAYYLARAYCYAITPAEANGNLSEDDLVPVDSSTEGRYSVSYEVPEGTDLYCHFFNVSVDGDETGEVTVTKYLCEEDYDYSSSSLEDLLEDCTQPHEGAGINLLKPGEGLYGGGTDASGGMTWSDFPSGPVTLRELTEGYALVRVYCHGVPADQQNNALGEYIESSIYRDGEFYHADTHLEPGYYLHCYLFNIPVEDFGTIIVHKYFCHPDFDSEGASREDFEANCTEPGTGVPFRVSYSEGGFTDTSTSSAGVAVWEDVPAGQIGISELTVPSTLLFPVYCGVTAQNALSLPDTWEPVAYQDGLNYELPPGQYLHCVFYNAPGDYGSLVITKYLCSVLQVGVGQDITYETFAQQCTDKGSGYQYTVSANGTDYPGLTDVNGEASWTTLSPGEVLISETLPTGYDSYAVYCTTDPENGPWDEYAGEQETSFNYTVETGVTLYCHWFNWVPDANTYVEVVKYRCPEGYDYARASYDDLIANCTDLIQNVPFTISNESGYLSTKQTNTEGIATWTTVPASLIRIQEGDVPQYAPVRVFCSQTPSENGGTPLFQGYDLDAVGHYIEIGVQEGYNLVCHWFNAPAEIGQVISIKLICDQFFTRGDAGYSDYLSNCTEFGEGFTFTLSTTQGDVVEQETTAQGGNGTVALVAPAGATYVLTEEPQPDYTLLAVYCTSDPSVPPTSPEDSPVSIDLQSGVNHYCYWFNAPSTAPDYEPGSIVLHKLNCPPGYPATSQGGRSPFEWLFEGCQQAASGVTFNVEQGGNTVGSGETDVSGTTVITGVAAGTTRISELPREGYGPPVVLCASYPVTTGRILVSFDEQTVDNWGHSYDLIQEEVLECYWFNFPSSQGEDGQPIQIIVHKYLCPDGYVINGAAYPEVSAACTTAEEGVNFEVTGGDGATSGGPTDLNGYAEYNGVSAGPILLTESPRQGYRTLAVYCTQYISTPGNPTAYTIDQEQLSWYLAPGYTFECYWYNVPVDEYGHVTVYKYYCHEDYDHASASRETIGQNCTEPGGQVMFNLGGPGGYSSDLQTDGGGRAEWTDLTPGAYVLTETPPEGYSPVRVYCTIYPDGAKNPTDPTYTGTWDEYTAGAAIDLTVEAGYWIYCVVYNAPVDDFGHVTLYKYTCHEDYEHASASREELAENCTEPGGQVMFNLGGPGGYSSDLPTDGGGRAEWTDLAPGAYILTETPPDGYYPVRIYCTLYPDEAKNPSDPTYAGTWDDYTGSPDNILDINLTVQSGYWIYCVWYNAPQPEYGYVVIYKYTCSEEPPYSTRDEYYANCTGTIPDVRFDITGPGGYAAFGQTDAGGLLTWSDVTAGTVNIWETPPQGYRPWAVYCGFTDPGNNVPTTWEERPIASDYGISHFVEYQKVLYCEWYNTPHEDDPPQVWIQKYSCPENADWHWNYHQLLSSCHEPGANVEYGIGPDENSLSLAVTDSTGRIVLGDLDPGTLTVQENYPSGYSGFVVYCQFATPHQTGSYQKADVYNRTIKLELDTGYVVTCVFFNFPDGHQPPEVSPPSTGHPPLQPPSGGSSGGSGSSSSGGTGSGGGTSGGSGVPSIGLPPVDPNTPASLIITKYTCEPAYDVLAELSDASVDCTELTDEIDFELGSIDDPAFASQSGQTGDDGEGRIAFDNLPAGSYLLTESLPEGTIAAFISTCESDRRDFQQENPFIPFAFAGPDGRIGVTLEPGETLECSWYDVPEEASGGEVTVLKFACPGATVIVAQCTPFTSGATITFTSIEGNDEPVSVTTGPDGSALANMEGTYAVQELPDTACLVDSDAFDESGNLVVAEGDQIEVRVYNCGVQT